MFRQLLISLVILVAVAAGYVYFVPGSNDTLARIGIKLPFGPGAAAGNTPQTASAAATPAGGTPGGTAPGGGRAGGPGGAYGRVQTPTVITAPVVFATINDKLAAIGEGMSVRSVAITSQATGTLTQLLVAPGDTVKAGQTIGQLDADTQQIAYDKATLAAKDAADALARATTLAKSNSATQVQLSTAQLVADNANLELRNAQLELTKRVIVTPIDGIVGLFQVTAGNAVAAQTVVTTVDDTSSILIKYWAPERYASAIKIGMPITAEAVALPGETFAGTVSAIDSRLDAASRTLQIQARVPNDKNQIRAGMSFAVSMSFPGDKFPAVDPLAIEWSADGAYVWKYQDSKVAKDIVQIIQRNSDGVLVKGDLKAGDQVVTQGVLQLTSGGPVTLLDDGSKKAAAAAVPSDAKAASARPAPQT